MDRLRINAREPATEIGLAVRLSPAAVRKRIQQLQEVGVIRAFTVILDHTKLNPASVEGYIEVSFSGGVNVSDVAERAVQDERIREVSTIAGDPDAIMRVRVDGLAELRQLVIWLRDEFEVTRTKALVVLDRTRQIYSGRAD